MAQKTAKPQFGRFDLLLATPRLQGGSPMRQLFADLEFRAIRTASTTEETRNSIAARTPDFLVLENTDFDDELCALIRDVRHGKLGRNAFTAIIAVTWDPSEHDIRKVVDAGADDILVQPISKKLLAERIHVLIHHRKGFAVTSGYIGPDRRREIEPGREGKPLIPVPKFLLSKATGNANLDDMQAEINQALQIINSEKLLENARTICNLAKRVSERLATSSFQKLDETELRKIEALGKEIAIRARSTRYAPIAKLCRSIVSVTDRLISTAETIDPKDIELLPELARSIETGLKNLENSSNETREIFESIDQSVKNVNAA